MQYLKEAKSNTPYVSIDTEVGKFQIIGVSNSENPKYPPDELHVVVFHDIVYHLGIDVVG
jgi:hypothetical protein